MLKGWKTDLKIYDLSNEIEEDKKKIIAVVEITNKKNEKLKRIFEFGYKRGIEWVIKFMESEIKGSKYFNSSIWGWWIEGKKSIKKNGNDCILEIWN